MKTTFRAKQPYAEILLETARAFSCASPAKPLRFMQKMKENQGFIGLISGKGPDEEGLERKNPLIVALGDSVTAGHFESLVPEEQTQVEKFFACVRIRSGGIDLHYSFLHQRQYVHRHPGHPDVWEH